MSRGLERERRVLGVLREEGWWAMRSPGSKGAVDIVAMKARHESRFIQVKSDDERYGPFNNFGPTDRAKLREAAGHAGAVPELAYWPPWGELRWIPSSEWP